MNRIRTTIAGAIVTMTCVASVGANGAAPPVPQTGTAGSVITLPRVTLTDPTGATHAVSLGALSSTAATAQQTLASLALSGPNVLGTQLPGWSAQTSNGADGGDHTIPLSSPAATGGLTVAGYSVSAAADQATSALGALSGSLTASNLGLHVDLGPHGLSSSSGRDSSSSALTLTAAGADVHLGDLLPADVLSALPLSSLLTLAQSLHLSVPTDATQVVTQLGNLATSLQQLISNATDLATARHQLATLLAGVPATQAAQQTLTSALQQLSSTVSQLNAASSQLSQDQAAVQSLTTQLSTANAAVTAAQAALTTATAQVNSLVAQLAANPLSILLQQQLTSAQAAQAQAQAALASAQAQAAALQTQLAAATATVASDQQTVSTLQQTVSSAQADADAAQSALDALVQVVATANQAVATAQQLVDSLVTTLTDALGQITTTAQALPDLHAVLTELLDLVTQAPLVDLGNVTMAVSAAADQAGGAGTVTCALAGMSVLGQAVPDGTCGSVTSGFATLASTLRSALTALPGAGVVPVPALDGLTPSTTGAAAATDDPSSTASAALTPLHLGLPSLSLQAVTDTVVSSLDAGLSQLNALLPNLNLPSATSAVTGALGTLTTAVGSLPTGVGLAGLRTLGVDLSLVGVSANALHNRALAAAPPPATTPGTTTAGSTTPGSTTPGSTTPGTTTPDTTPSQPRQTPQHSRGLPFTGSDSLVDAAIAALVLLAGAHLTVLGRRRRT